MADRLLGAQQENNDNISEGNSQNLFQSRTFYKIESNMKTGVVRQMQQDKAVLDQIAFNWQSAKSVAVFTGAGMSTESGLPDFRSQQGLWKHRPESLATLTALHNTPDEFYFFYQWRIRQLWQVGPNSGHRALASLAKANRIQRVVTQNVDGLHQQAGSQQVCELHGSLKTVSCLDCRARYDSRQLLPQQEGWEAAYQNGTYRHGAECFCPRCQGKLRPDVVLFGEALPEHPWQQAVQAARAARLFVVVGSSLLVSPANLLPQMALEQGAKLLIINQDKTPLDAQANWKLSGRAAETLFQIAALLAD